jgi:NAD(P)-dependent dehydrogenase (short-subunit alcohol dehydrogenase family)
MAAIRAVAFAAMIGTAVIDYGDVTPAATMRKRPQICSIMSSKEESVDQFLFDPLLTNALDRIDDAVGISEVDPLFYNSFQRIIAVSYKRNNEDPINNREEVEECMTSFIVVMRYITLISPLLSATYAIAVHLFLSFWRERSLLDFRFYFRLADCIIFAAFNSIVWVACHRQHALSMSMAIETLSTVVSVAVSSANISQTRKIWVDGPMPPYSNNTTHLKDTNVFITGANSGIGLETSRQLYQRGATIFLGCRSKERALEAMRNIDPTYEIDGDATVEEEKEQRRTARKRRMYFVELDLSSFVSVRGAVRLFLDMNVPLHVLINNAGVMRKDRKLSVDGNEMTMAANHIGHFLLTNLLLPKLRQSAFEVGRPSRVITVSSSLYANARCQCTTSDVVRPGIDLLDLQCERKKYRMFEQYAQSKVANVMFAIELGRRERRRWQDQQTEIAATATPTKKDRKKLRPKLTPNIHTVTEKDDLGLGFGDILPSPGGDTSSSNEVENTSNISGKKTLKPKLQPLSSSISSYGDGLGFNDIIRTPVAKTTEIKVEEDEDITEGDLVRKKEEKMKLRPKMFSGDEYSMDDGGLGFEDFVSARSAMKKKLVEVTEEVEDENMTNDALKSWTLSHPPVLSYCLHPGLVRTDFVRDMPWYLYYLNKVFALFLATLQKKTCAGAYTSIFCVVMDTIDTDVDECYFVNSKIQPILRSASNEEDCKKLWELSDRITSG